VPRSLKRGKMTKSKLEASCSTCGTVFKRKRPRQRKCDNCDREGVFLCRHCEKPYKRREEIKLCSRCLARFRPDTGEISLKPAELKEAWNENLITLGLAANRGEFIGTTKLHSYIQKNIGPDGDEMTTAEQAEIGVCAKTAETVAAADVKDVVGRLHLTEDRFIIPPELESSLVDFFVHGNLAELARLTDLHHEEIRRLRSKIQDIADDREALAMEAHRALGGTDQEWTVRRLRKGLAEAARKRGNFKMCAKIVALFSITYASRTDRTNFLRPARQIVGTRYRLVGVQSSETTQPQGALAGACLEGRMARTFERRTHIVFGEAWVFAEQSSDTGDALVVYLPAADRMAVLLGDPAYWVGDAAPSQATAEITRAYRTWKLANPTRAEPLEQPQPVRSTRSVRKMNNGRAKKGSVAAAH
jgi:hypothetical protein